MKKFYLLILTTGFLLTSLFTQAQFAGVFSTIPNDGNNHILSDVSIWEPPGEPPAHCNNCEIIINCDVTLDATSVDIELSNNSLVQINGGVTFTIDNYLQLFNTQIIVGSDATTAASVILNDQVDLNGTSSVQLANVNTFIDANNTALNPISGPHFVYGSATNKVAGLYFITATDPFGFTFTLSAIGIGSSTASMALYNLNCFPTVPASPNNCASGIVFGPATTSLDPSVPSEGLIFMESATLPVELVQFVATRNPDQTIRLSWATAQEINSGSFDVERSADLVSWTKIGNVKAKGYASTTTNYSYTDEFPLAGTGYYRLKMIDLDGKYLYSNILTVSSDNSSQPLVVYSNPFSDAIRVKVNVDRAENLTLTVSDIIGKTYLKQSYNAQAGDNLIDLVPAGAASGMYILHIQGNTYEQTVKLVKQ